MRFDEGRYRFDREIVRAFETERSVEIPVPLSSTLRLRSNRGSSGRRVPWRISSSAAPARRSLEVLLVGISRASPRAPRDRPHCSRRRADAIGSLERPAAGRFPRCRSTEPRAMGDGAGGPATTGRAVHEDGERSRLLARSAEDARADAPARAARRRSRSSPPRSSSSSSSRRWHARRSRSPARRSRSRRPPSARPLPAFTPPRPMMRLRPTTRLHLDPSSSTRVARLGARRARATAEPPRTRSRPPASTTRTSGNGALKR